jgi:cation diffusion facilitator family transporter
MSMPAERRWTPADSRVKKRVILLSFAVSLVLLAIKYAAYLVTHSAAILSDALESIINVVAAAFALFSVSLSARPADENHPYGHGKIEYFSAGFEGALIFLAGITIIVTSAMKMMNPEPLERTGLGMALVIGASAVNLALGLYLVKQGRLTGSLAIEADGRHLLTDVWTSGGALAGVALVVLTGWLRFDPLMAMLLGCNILISGWRLVRTSAGHLMDEADDGLLDEIVHCLRESRRPGWIQPHQLRATMFGSRLVVDLHIYMPRFWDLVRVNEESERIDAALRRRFGEDTEAIIHVDPCLPMHCESCGLESCPARTALHLRPEDWTTRGIKSTGAHPAVTI